MTYEEALQCEEHAKESLKEFPMEVNEQKNLSQKYLQMFCKQTSSN